MPVNLRQSSLQKFARSLNGGNALFKKYILKNLSRTSQAALAAGFWLAFTDLAVAQQATTLGDVICNGFNNAKPFATAFQYVAYATGIFMGLQGIFHLKGTTESPQNYPLHKSMMLFFGSMCLLALPSAVAAIVSSLYTTSGTGGTLTCSQGTTGPGGAGLDQMVEGFVGNMAGPTVSFVSIIAMVSGLFMIIRGLVKAGRYGFDPKTNSASSILTHIIFGALLMTIGDNLNMMLLSVFGTGSSAPSINTTTAASSVLQWGFVGQLGGSQQFANAVGAALTFVQVIGAIAFVRGWMVMKKVVEGNGNVTMAQGITHIIGGVLAINIFFFLQLMDTTFGTGMLGTSG